MFSDLAVSQGSPVRRWTAVASFTLQAALVGVALVYPLLHVESLPPLMRTLLPPVATFATPARPQTNGGHSGGPTIHPIVVSNHIFLGPQVSVINADPGPELPLSIGLPGDRYQRGIDQLIGSEYARPLPTVAAPAHLRTSVMMEGNLIHRVEPRYPLIAKQLHIEGVVMVKAFISRDGVITRAVAESGPPLLVTVALEAVRQWRYRPYYLNHEPIEVETEITVNFVLQR